MSINSAHISGYCGKYIFHSVCKNGVAVAKFSLAVRGLYGHLDWIPITCFGIVANNVRKYWIQGASLFLFGRIKNEMWTNKEGVRMRKFSIYAAYVEFAINGKGGKDINLSIMNGVDNDVELYENMEEVTEEEEKTSSNKALATAEMVRGKSMTATFGEVAMKKARRKPIQVKAKAEVIPDE